MLLIFALRPKSSNDYRTCQPKTRKEIRSADHALHPIHITRGLTNYALLPPGPPNLLPHPVTFKRCRGATPNMLPQACASFFRRKNGHDRFAAILTCPAHSNRSQGTSSLPGSLEGDTLRRRDHRGHAGRGDHALHGHPGFRAADHLPYPAIARLGDDWLCIDGPELVTQAIASGASQIRCRVFHLSQPDLIEVAILKAAIRVVPAGGPCLYPEIVRNTRRLFALLMASPQPPVVFAHGGDRHGESFTSNKEEDVRTLLGSRLGKKRSTISNYLVHGEYLTDEAFAILVARSLGKGFFEKAQVPKRILVKNLKSEGRSDPEVTQTVSAQIIVWAADYQEGRDLREVGPVDSGPQEPDATVPPPEEEPPLDPRAPEAFDHWQGEPVTADPPTASSIRAEFQAIRDAIDRAPAEDTELLACAQALALEVIESCARIQQLAIHIQRAEEEV